MTTGPSTCSPGLSGAPEMPAVSRSLANGLSADVRGGSVDGITAGQERAPGRTRTCDLEIRRLLLYPAELRGHVPAADAGNA
jgi:hypothetical protein